jgi:prophage endopeptidase
MNAQVAKLLGLLALALVLICCGAAGAWQWQANKYDKELSDQAVAHQADMTTIANGATVQARQALEKQQAQEQALAALDQKAQEDKTHALAENDKLRTDIVSGARRMRLAGSCSAGGTNLSGTAVGASLGDASTFELSAAAGSTVLSIRAGIIADQAALKALQSYVESVCR